MNQTATRAGPGRPVQTPQRAFELLTESFREVAREVGRELTLAKLQELTLLHYEIEQCRAQKDLIRHTAEFLTTGTGRVANPVAMELSVIREQSRIEEGPLKDSIVPATRILARTMLTEMLIPADSSARAEIRAGYIGTAATTT